MNHRHRILVVAVAAICSLLAVAPAQAKKKPAPAAANATLASASGAVTTTRQTASRAAARLLACYAVQVRRWGKNLLGMTLWTYYQRIEWCSSGGKITSVTRLRWGEVSFPGWAFKGHTLSHTSGGKGSTSYRARTQGHFCLAEYFSCVQNAYPWIDITVRANGTYTFSHGG